MRCKKRKRFGVGPGERLAYKSRKGVYDTPGKLPGAPPSDSALLRGLIVNSSETRQQFREVHTIDSKICEQYGVKYVSEAIAQILAANGI